MTRTDITLQIIFSHKNRNRVDKYVKSVNPYFRLGDVNKIMKKRLFVVTNIPRYSEERSDYCYVIKAESYAEAIEIVKRKTGHEWNWDAILADNEEVWN